DVALSQRVTYDVAGDMFERLQSQSMRYHAERGTGDVVRRVTVDSASVATVLVGAVIPVVNALFTMATMVWLMARLDSSLLPYALVAVPLILLALGQFGARMVDRSVIEQDLE